MELLLLCGRYSRSECYAMIKGAGFHESQFYMLLPHHRPFFQLLGKHHQAGSLKRSLGIPRAQLDLFMNARDR
jgi:hypothetical protein